MIQTARGTKIDSLEAASVLKIIKKTEKIRRLGQESSTWSLFGAD